MSVLIIDDEPCIRKTIAVVLERMGLHLLLEESLGPLTPGNWTCSPTPELAHQLPAKRSP